MSQPLILLVEDEPESRDGYAEWLERAGFRVAISGTADDAIAAIGVLAPDVIVTDIALPGRDGFSLAQEVRSHPCGRHVPLVAMTAHWDSEVHNRAEQAGIQATLLKPCQPEHLIAELNRILLQLRSVRSQPSAAASQPDPIG